MLKFRKKLKRNDFSDPVEIFVTKVGVYLQINAYMKMFEYQKSTFVQNHSYVNNFEYHLLQSHCGLPLHRPFITALPFSWYDWNTIEKNVKWRFIHSSFKATGSTEDKLSVEVPLAEETKECLNDHVHTTRMVFRTIHVEEFESWSLLTAG